MTSQVLLCALFGISVSQTLFMYAHRGGASAISYTLQCNAQNQVDEVDSHGMTGYALIRAKTHWVYQSLRHNLDTPIEAGLQQ